MTDVQIITCENMLVGPDLEATNMCSVLVVDNIIEEILPQEVAINKYPEVKVHEYKQGTLMPGMIDCHNHLDWDCNIPNFVSISQGSEALLSIIAMKNLKEDLFSGVTSSRYMGGHYFLDVQFKGFTERGLVEGPQMYVSGIGIRSSAGHGYIGEPFDGISSITKAVRNNLLNKVDWIKFYITGSHLGSSCTPKAYYSRQEIATIIDLSHRAGVPSTAHCIGGVGMDDAIELGIDCLEHCHFINEQQIEQLIKKDITVCLTMSEYFTQKQYMPQEMDAKYRKDENIVHRNMERLIASGVKYVLGTDGMHGALWEEANYLVEHGANTHEALLSLTINAARLLGISDKYGSIDVGKYADLVVVDGNPLEDISILERVISVYKLGRKVERHL